MSTPLPSSNPPAASLPSTPSSESRYREAPWGFTLIAFWLMTAMIALLWRKIDSSDVLFHLRAGQSILRAGQVPNNDIFSVSSPVGLWVYFDWFWGQSLAICYDAFEWVGVNSLGVLCGAAIVALTMMRCVRWGARWFESIIITMLSFAVLVPQLQPAPVAAALPIFLLSLMFTEAKRRQWPMIFVPALAALWANIHIGATLILLVPLVRAFILPPANDTDRRSISPHFFWIVIAGGVLGFLVNPYSHRLIPAWWHAGLLQAGQFPSTIVDAFSNFEIVIRFGMVLVLALVSVLYRTLTRQSMVIAGILLAIALLFSPQSLNFLILYLSAPAAVALSKVLRSAWQSTANVQAATATALLLSTIFLQIIVLVSAGLAPSAFGSGVRPGIFPETASGRLSALPLRASIFNQEKDANYLLWRLWPGWKTCIDTRLGLYDKAFRDNYEKIWQGGQGWESMLTMWRAYAVLGSPDIVEQYPKHNLYDDLAVSPDWIPVYWDRTSILYLKRDIDLTNTNLEPFRQLKPGLRWDEMASRIKSPLQWRELAADLRRVLADDASNSVAAEFLRRTEERLATP